MVVWYFFSASSSFYSAYSAPDTGGRATQTVVKRSTETTV